MPRGKLSKFDVTEEWLEHGGHFTVNELTC